MNTILYPSQTTSSFKGWLVRPLAWRVTPSAIVLGAIVLLSLGLHLYNIQSIGDSNTYYTAAVKSMLQSWHNFFFVSAEPGGSVSVDKPPLGLWIETAFAAVLGVSGFSVVLPNILAGVLSVLLLYHLVKRHFGVGAGLIAALVLTVTPVSLAADRNNTIDSMLILSMLLAAWAFIKATESNSLRYLFLGAFLVGLGFNIKMLQAFLPLPAFYAYYLFGSKTEWKRKVLNLGLASLLLAVVSLAWMVAVDLTPADQRPYVGGSAGNSEMELAFGYNGLNRLVGLSRSAAQPGNTQNIMSNIPDGNGIGADDGAGFPPPNPGGGFPPPTTGMNQGSGFQPPQPPLGGMPGGGGPGMQDIGEKSALRFFKTPMAKEMSWLLPFALISIFLAAFSGKIHLPLVSEQHKSLVLWGGWLLTCLVFFSAAGFFHNYYLATLSPALAAMVGIGFASFTKLMEHKRWLVVLGLCTSAAATLAFQLYLVSQMGLNGIWVWLASSPFILAAATFLVVFVRIRNQVVWEKKQVILFRLANILVLLSMVVIPAVWSVRTVVSGTSNMLPAAFSGDNSVNGHFPDGGRNAPPGPGNNFGVVNESTLTYLQENTKDIKYLLAVPSANMGDELVLKTGRPVLFMGGFNGSDIVVDSSDLAKLVADGDLRYVLYGGMQPGPSGTNTDVSDWLKSSCQVVSGTEQSTGKNPAMRGESGSLLYQCGNL